MTVIWTLHLTLYKGIFVHIVGLQTVYERVTCFSDNLSFLAGYNRPSWAKSEAITPSIQFVKRLKPWKCNTHLVISPGRDDVFVPALINTPLSRSQTLLVQSHAKPYHAGRGHNNWIEWKQAILEATECYTLQAFGGIRFVRSSQTCVIHLQMRYYPTQNIAHFT